MTEEKKLLATLQVAVPPETPLSVVSELKILQMLGIASNHELSKAIDIAATLIPLSVQANLHGLITLLTEIVRNHPNTKQEHHDELSKLLKKMNDVPDASLTFGTFLPFCEALLKHKPQSSADNKQLERRAKRNT
jgi:hypothetical protein